MTPAHCGPHFDVVAIARVQEIRAEQQENDVRGLQLGVDLAVEIVPRGIAKSAQPASFPCLLAIPCIANALHESLDEDRDHSSPESDP